MRRRQLLRALAAGTASLVSARPRPAIAAPLNIKYDTCIASPRILIPILKNYQRPTVR